MATSSETDIAQSPIRPGIYHIAVASHGAFLHERLTAGIHLTVAPPSAHPDSKQVWQVHQGRKPGTITIARPGIIRPALSITIKGDHAHPKPGDKLVLAREEFSTDWFPDPEAPHRYYIRVPKLHSIKPHVAEAHVIESEDAEGLKPKTLGFAVAPEKIHPPFLEIDDKNQLVWLFQFLRPQATLEDEAEA